MTKKEIDNMKLFVCVCACTFEGALNICPGSYFLSPHLLSSLLLFLSLSLSPKRFNEAWMLNP